jgi:rhamnogalacturonyl hydrolase YesR
LSVWNLVEAYDATKDPRYLEDLKDRVDRMLYLQNGPDQYDNLVIDRYGYSQVYASQGLYKYYQLTKEERVKQALIRHARAVRDNPPYNHEYESYLATIHSLLIGYEFTKEKSFLDEAKHRSEVLKMDELTSTFEELGTQRAIGDALNAVSHLPEQGALSPPSRWVENWNVLQGLRVFGWTHIYNIPWLIHCLNEEEANK